MSNISQELFDATRAAAERQHTADMQTYAEIEAEVRKLAHSLPPSDLGSTRAIQAVAQYVLMKITATAKAEREAALKRYEL